MAIQKVRLSHKIGDSLVSIYPQTSSDIVTYSNDEFFADKLNDGVSNVKEALDYVLNEITNIEAGEINYDGINQLIYDACKDLYEKIMGEDYEEIEEVYKTLKGIADWIEEHGTEATAMLEQLNELQATTEALESAVFVYDDETETYDTTQYNFSKVEASETNGNIIVDGEEVVVYTSPVSDEDIEKWNQASENATQALEDAATAQSTAEVAQAAAEEAQEAAEAAAEAAEDVIIYVENEDSMPDEISDSALYLIGIADLEDDDDGNTGGTGDTGDTGGNTGGSGRP